jgi:carbamoyl-phosphate synthase large subunit
LKTKQQITVAVTGLNNIDSPGPGVAVIRALKESINFDVRIVGLSYESMEPGIYMPNIADTVYQIPYPTAGIETLLQQLIIINEQEKIDLIIPNFDAELFNFIKIAKPLNDLGIRTFLPSHAQLESCSKTNLFAFGQQHQLKVPRDKQLFNSTQLITAAQELNYPIVVKGKYYEAAVCYTLEQAEKTFFKLQAKWGLPIIVQEFIKGTEVNVAALGDGQGNMISCIPMKKMYITDKGKAWSGITIDDENLIALAKKFIAKTKWKGGLELEIMKTMANEYFIMEVNPRFPAWIYLTAAAGQNQPDALLNMAMGKAIEPFENYEIGKIFIRYAWDMIIDVAQFQEFSAYGKR